MSKAKIKNYVMYRIATFDGKAKCFIHCFPQQIWSCYINSISVKLERKGVVLVIPREDFDKHWKVIE